MIASNTTEERQAALSSAEGAYNAWADRHRIDADEATDAQLAELDRLQAEAEQRAVTRAQPIPPERRLLGSSTAEPTAEAIQAAVGPRAPRKTRGTPPNRLIRAGTG